jgi:hypothetical protein
MNFQDDHIDLFIYCESDNIIDLYYEIENRHPYFLHNMSSSHLMCFIIDYNFGLYQNTKKYNYQHLAYFEHEFITEIDTTLMLINNYVYRFKRLNINYTDWLKFCYDFTKHY